MHELKINNLLNAKCSIHYMNILYFLDWWGAFNKKIKRIHLRYFLEKGYNEKLSKSQKQKLNLETKIHFIFDESDLYAWKYKFIDLDNKIEDSNHLTFYLKQLKNLGLISWNKNTGEISITNKGSEFIQLEYSHFLIDKLYYEKPIKENLLMNLPELLVLNISEDFVGNYKYDKVININITGKTTEEKLKSLKEQLKKVKLDNGILKY